MKKRLFTFVLACFLLFVTGCSGNAVDEQEILSEESDVAETETTATSGSETGSELSSTETTASAKKDISNSEACLILDDAVDSIGDTADAVIDALEYWNDNDFSTYDDILDYQLMWAEIVADIYQIADEFDAVQPSSGYQYLWSHIGDEIRNAGDALYSCTHLDEDSDGTTTGSEAKRQLQEGTSEYTTYMTTVIEDIDVLKTSLSKKVHPNIQHI
ncbi:MAG: hypothetical protein LUD79_03715 [Oscillospiraceae bacterium]|nr:hypothetical protein [Oscillospiraceae bacterium]